MECWVGSKLASAPVKHITLVKEKWKGLQSVVTIWDVRRIARIYPVRTQTVWMTDIQTNRL